MHRLALALLLTGCTWDALPAPGGDLDPITLEPRVQAPAQRPAAEPPEPLQTDGLAVLVETADSLQLVELNGDGTERSRRHLHDAEGSSWPTLDRLPGGDYLFTVDERLWRAGEDVAPFGPNTPVYGLIAGDDGSATITDEDTFIQVGDDGVVVSSERVDDPWQGACFMDGQGDLVLDGVGPQLVWVDGTDVLDTLVLDSQGWLDQLAVDPSGLIFVATLGLDDLVVIGDEPLSLLLDVDVGDLATAGGETVWVLTVEGDELRRYGRNGGLLQTLRPRSTERWLAITTW